MLWKTSAIEPFFKQIEVSYCLLMEDRWEGNTMDFNILECCWGSSGKTFLIQVLDMLGRQEALLNS